MQDINEIIKNNAGLVYAQLHKYKLVNDPDAESFAYEALFNAVKTFDDTLDVKFGTYATACIYNALGCHVRRLHKKKQLDVMSYNAIAFTDDTGEHEHLEYIDSGVVIDDDLIRGELVEATRTAVKEVVEAIDNEKRKEIIKLYIASEYEATTSQIARETGVSQSYASPAINIFKGQLRKKLEDIYNA